MRWSRFSALKPPRQAETSHANEPHVSPICVCTAQGACLSLTRGGKSGYYDAQSAASTCAAFSRSETITSRLAHDQSMRHRVDELMDDPALDAAAHLEALEGLSRINALSNTTRLLWRPLARLAERLDRPLRVLDVATGAGDVPIRLARRAQQARIAMEIDACDISSRALEHAARRASAANLPIHWKCCDILSTPPEEEYDAVISSLFLHHLDEPQAVRCLRIMRDATRRLLLVHDLHRGAAAWLLTWCATRLITRSPVVHVDGPRSVRAAFTVKEAAELAERAGLSGARVTRRWPLRFLLEWRRS
ncbi:MAG: methyltransferase domain-containing protein [Planctomycetota bacterium]|nr:MAG: methyltransferase domain-containing protein [Planctomycetota bacterium]